METINDRIRKIRESLGMTTGELAERLGVSHSSIQHIESGRNSPHIQFITKLHQHIPQYNIFWILYGEEQMTEKEADIPGLELNAKEYKLPDDKNEIIDIQKHGSAQHSFTPTCPFLDYKVKKLFQANANEELLKKATRINKSKSPDIKEIRQTIDGLKRSIAKLESWLDDMVDEGFNLPDE